MVPTFALFSFLGFPFMLAVNLIFFSYSFISRYACHVNLRHFINLKLSTRCNISCISLYVLSSSPLFFQWNMHFSYNLPVEFSKSIHFCMVYLFQEHNILRHLAIYRCDDSCCVPLVYDTVKSHTFIHCFGGIFHNSRSKVKTV